MQWDGEWMRGIGSEDGNRATMDDWKRFATSLQFGLWNLMCLTSLEPSGQPVIRTNFHRAKCNRRKRWGA
jgi:hypothetical protein